MRIGIIGAGNVGTAIGGAWSRKGHQVVYGVPSPKDAKYTAVGSGKVISPKEAVAGAEVILLATPWPAAEAACRSLGDVTGRVIIDRTNAIAMGPDGIGPAAGLKGSAAETVQSWCPGAHVFKSLNQTGFEVMGDTSHLAARPVMFVAGDDAVGKATVLALVGDLGFEAVDSGPLRTARFLESLAMLWISLVFRQGMPRNFAMSLARPAA